MKTLLYILLFGMLVSISAFAQMPHKIHYQGVLNDQNGNPVSGLRSMEFRLYDLLEGGTPLWTQGPQNVQVNKGGFNVVLGPFPEEVDFSIPYYFELVVAGSVLSPREELASAPYALRSANSDNARHANRSDHSDRSDHSNRSDRANRADVADSLADNTVTSPKIVDGSIQFIDIAQNDAQPGQVIKWNGSAWVAADDNLTTGGSVSLVNTGTGLTGGPITTTGTISILPNGVTNDLIADNSVIGSKILDGSIENRDLKNYMITINTGTGLIGGGTIPLGGSLTLSSTANSTFLLLAGGIMNGPITNTGNPSITMGKGNFGQGNLNTGEFSFVAGSFNRARGRYSVVSGGGGSQLADSNSSVGDYSTVSGGIRNKALSNLSTISGGAQNIAYDGATVGGGVLNTANGYRSTVSGGSDNQAIGMLSTVCGGAENVSSGEFSIILGGHRNRAYGNFSFAGGYLANAVHTGSFIWADGVGYPIGIPFFSERDNQFRIRANGGGRFDINNNRWVIIYDDGTNLISTSSGARLTLGGVWTNTSDKNLKENFNPVDNKLILEKVVSLPISIWNYKSENPSVKHIGPTAQDFYERFGLGEDDKSISTVDPAGIALAAIQQLKKENDTMRLEIEKLQAQVKLLLDIKLVGYQNNSTEQIADKCLVKK
jgi:hypothetical protein